MNLYQDLFLEVLDSSELEPFGEAIMQKADSIIHDKCYIALSKIQRILNNPRLDDQECFDRIEEIVRVYEQMGSIGGI